MGKEKTTTAARRHGELFQKRQSVQGFNLFDKKLKNFCAIWIKEYLNRNKSLCRRAAVVVI